MMNSTDRVGSHVAAAAAANDGAAASAVTTAMLQIPWMRMFNSSYVPGR
jgi:hypothetical protein